MCTGIAVDAAGHASVTGNTSAADFPITSDAFQTTFGGGPGGSGEAFVSTLNATGSALVYSTYRGGNDLDNGTGIAVDAAGHASVAGSSFSAHFPTISGPFPTIGGGVVDAFVTKVVVLTFAGTPGTPNCHGQRVAALAQQYGGLDAAAAALGCPSVQARQDAMQECCAGSPLARGVRREHPDGAYAVQLGGRGLVRKPRGLWRFDGTSRLQTPGEFVPRRLGQQPPSDPGAPHQGRGSRSSRVFPAPGLG